MNNRSLIGFAFFSLAIAACTKVNNTRADLDIRSHDGDAFVECRGSDDCDDKIVKMLVDMKPPTQADLDETRRQHIWELEHPKDYHCDLPTVPRESFIVKDGGPSADLPGDTFLQYGPAQWSKKDLETHPQIRDDDKPIGIYQQGNSLTWVYRLRETNELVTCGRWYGRDIPDTCDIKHRVPKELCSYTHTIYFGH